MAKSQALTPYQRMVRVAAVELAGGWMSLGLSSEVYLQAAEATLLAAGISEERAREVAYASALLAALKAIVESKPQVLDMTDMLRACACCKGPWRPPDEPLQHKATCPILAAQTLIAQVEGN